MAYKYKSSIQTRSGKDFDLIEPSKNEFTVEDVAHALSNICRYCGHVSEFYSVAQHSVMVSKLVEPQYALIGLLHDASEAFVGDVAKPLKELLPDYKQVEARIEEFVLSRFGIDPHNIPASIKTADIIALVTEQRDLMHGPDAELMRKYKVAPLEEKIIPLPPKQAKDLFLERYREIRWQEDKHQSKKGVTSGKKRAAVYDHESESLIAQLIGSK